MRRPLLIWAVLFALGILLGRHAPISSHGWAALSMMTALILLGEAWVHRTRPPERLDDPRPQVRRRRSAETVVRFLLPSLLLVACGAFTYAWHLDRLETALAPWVGEGPVQWSGWVIERPVATSPGRTSLIVQVHRVNEGTVRTAGRVRLVVRDNSDGINAGRKSTRRMADEVPPDPAGGHPFRYGDRVVVQSGLRAPREPGNPGEFDEWGWLSRLGVSATAYVSRSDVRIVGSRWAEASFALGASIRRWAITGQQWLAQAATTGVPAPVRPLLGAILAGDRSALSEQMEAHFRASGMVHLLSVSGLHVGLMAAFVVGFLHKALRLSFVWSAGSAIPLVAFYVLLTGAAPPAVRAGLTVSLGLIAYARGHPRDAVNGVGMAALSILLSNPFLLFGPSFQLSFAATLSILFAVRPFSSTLRRTWPRMPKRAADFLAVPTAAQLGLYPLIAHHFRTLAPVGLVANLGAGSLLGLILPLGLLTAGLSVVDGVTGLNWAAWVGKGNGWLLSILAAWSEWFADLPYAQLQVRRPPAWVFITYYVTIGLLVGRRALADSGRPLGPLLTRRSWRAVLFGSLIGAAVIAWWPAAAPALRPLEITLIDVGQGDAALVRTPGGKVALIDGGGHPEYEDGERDFDVGEAILIPYLHERGIERIDWIFLSHAHEDHVEGVAAVLREFPVGGVVDPGVFHEAPSYIEYLTLVDRRRIPRLRGEAGMELKFPDGVQFRILGPTRSMRRRFADDPDNASLVVEIRFGAFRMLFTGDLDAEGQRELLRRGVIVEMAGPISVLKVPHHGSRNAYFGPFLDVLSPEVALISTGPNPYGHPHAEVLEALHRRGIRVYRTDLHGAITIHTDGEGMEVRTHRETGSAGRLIHLGRGRGCRACA